MVIVKRNIRNKTFKDSNTCHKLYYYNVNILGVWMTKLIFHRRGDVIGGSTRCKQIFRIHQKYFQFFRTVGTTRAFRYNSLSVSN